MFVVCRPVIMGMFELVSLKNTSLVRSSVETQINEIKVHRDLLLFDTHRRTGTVKCEWQMFHRVSNVKLINE